MEPILKSINSHLSKGNSELALTILLERCIETRHSFYIELFNKMLSKLSYKDATLAASDECFKLDSDLKYHSSSPLADLVND